MAATSGPVIARRALLGLLAAVALVGCVAAERDARQDERAEPQADEPEQPAGPTDVGPTDFDPAFHADPECFGIEPSGLEPDQFQCGTVEVPLRHDDPDAATIELAVAVLAGSGTGADDSPVLLLGGGPGEVMVEPHLTRPTVRHVFDVGREVIVLDQRGVGASSPALECPELPSVEMRETAVESIDATLDALADCRSRLAESIDLDGFNHLDNARDVELVRRALGHDQINLRGTSYGTQVALLAAQMFPDTVRSVILSSPLDPSANWIDGATAGFEQALGRIDDACSADPQCREQLGDLNAAIEDTVDRLAGQPEEVTVQLPGGEPQTRTFNPATYLGGLFVLFYQSDLTSMLPAFVRHAHDGDLEPLALVLEFLDQQLEGMISTGMQHSMVCSGEGALSTPEAALGDVDSPLLEQHWFPGNLFGESMGAVCDTWDVELAYDPAEISLDTEVPTLIVTGTLDHVTPPQLGEQVHAALPNSHLIEVPGASHGPLSTLSLPGPCGQQIAGAFLDDPDVRPDDTCATENQLRLRTRLPLGLG